MTVVGLFLYQQSFSKPHRLSVSILFSTSCWSKPNHQARVCEPPDVIFNLLSKLLAIFVSYKTYSVSFCNVVRGREQQTWNRMKKWKKIDLLFAALEVRHKHCDSHTYSQHFPTKKIVWRKWRTLLYFF